MDVTVRASQQARQGNVQETQNEGEALIEFGTFFSQFNSTSRGLQSVGDLAMPCNELTQGMTSNEGMDDHQSSQSLIESDAGHEDASEQRQSTDDVTASRALLSEQRHTDHQMSSKHARVAQQKRDGDVSDTDQQVEAALSQERLNDVVREKATEGETKVDPAQLSSDAYGNAQTVQSVAQVRSTDVQPEADLGGSGRSRKRSHSQQIRRQSFAEGSHAGIEQMSDLDPAVIEHAKLKQKNPSMNVSSQAQNESLKSNGQLPVETVVEEPSMEGMSESDTGGLETSSKANERNHVGTQQSSEQLKDLSAFTAAGKSGLVSTQSQHTGDTVQLSAKGRTIGNLVGSNTRAKFNLRQQVKEPALARTQTPSRDVELPEDVDKLSVMSQISDGMKLRFGGDQTLEVNLNPAELGRVRLQLEMQGDKTVNIKVSAEHAVIADLLHLNLNELRKELLAQGVQVNHIEVDVDAHGQDTEQQDEQQTDPDEHVDNQTENESDDGTQRHQISIQA